ncbi:MAG: TonB C-terminal domain-containing protein [Candidatus Hydrogenedentota bacterium]
MSQRTRILLALFLSLALHAILGAAIALTPEPRVATAPLVPPSFVVDLDAPDRQLRIVESGAKTDTTAPKSDLISDANSRAQDMVESEEETGQPSPEIEDEFESPPSTGAPATPPELSAAEPDDTALQETSSEPEPREDAAMPAKEDVHVARIPAAQDTSVLPKVGQAVAAQSAETPPAKLAEASTVELPAEPRPSSGRRGGIEAKGFTSYQANKHEMAAYMLEVRRRIERNWRAALSLRYSGATATETLMEFAIAPSGRLMRATVVDAGDSVVFAALCKDSIEKAAPFPPFPFEVPKVYRDQDMVIRVTFRFL